MSGQGMTRRKFIKTFAVTAAGTAVFAALPVHAETPPSKTKTKTTPTQKPTATVPVGAEPTPDGDSALGKSKAKPAAKVTRRVAHADRKSAAGRMRTARDVAGVSAQADYVPKAGEAPRYFTMPNYANSPQRLTDAIVVIDPPTDAAGTQATATATVDPVTGAITAFTVTNAGSGYATAPGVTITTASVTPTTVATATAVIDSGVVNSITLGAAGAGYTAPAVTIDPPTDLAGTQATAIATGGVDAVLIANGGSGYTNPVVVFSLPDVPGGTQAVGHATLSGGVVTAVVVDNGGSGYLDAPAAAIVDTTGSGAAATATLKLLAITMTNFGSGYDPAAPPSVTISDTGVGTGASATATVGTGSVIAVNVTNPGAGYVTKGIRKFVDTLPGLGPAGANNLGQYIPVAVPDTTTYPGSDYYEIAVVEYQEQMHSDLPKTTLRGYVQLSTSVVPGSQVALTNPQDNTPVLLPNGSPALAVDKPHYLGPAIVATKDKPVRILFRNLLPTGHYQGPGTLRGGDLFIPVDTTVMGSGMGPDMGGMAEMDPQHPMAGEYPKPMGTFAENRATLHLHGGFSPWISDGTPHQWTTPAGEGTSYPKGVSVSLVPDMPDPGPGAITFFYSNQQGARLMFYHDHAWGITRLNVYVGEAAPYVITDQAEADLIAGGLIPGPADTLYLVVQDKTFVPTPAELAWWDSTWDSDRWGGYGQLWMPHVYSPAQNPGDSSGVNPYGRWAYGPWFWPPTNSIAYGPVANPYAEAGVPWSDTTDPARPAPAWWKPSPVVGEPPEMPGTPFLSMGMEAFNDTPVVNGTVYPTVTLEPRAYRMRILNAANDRFFNLQFYEADPAAGTEVALNAAEVAAALADPAGVFPTPDPAKSPAGPAWLQIASEGGFLPEPVVVPNQVTTWVTDPTVFNAGNVDQHSLLLGPAERADVIVDFSKHAGKTLILYNDAPAAFPARDPRYDYYTGNADLRDTGGAAPTIAGFGPNTRTVMQIKVNVGANGPATTPAPDYVDQTRLAALRAAFAHKPDGSGVFESAQPPIIVGQAAYNSAYGTSFTPFSNQAQKPYRDGYARITDFSMYFETLAGQASANELSFIDFQPKAIQDEMGEAFDHDYGRMSGNLGVEVKNTQAGVQQNLILYPYVNPPDAIINQVTAPGPVALPPPDAAGRRVINDGTQIWKITHNGVDTHPIHFHLFDVQLINRVGWDGIIRPPHATELGWKETIRVSPLEDTIVALRPRAPKLPFGLPDSLRPYNPMMPLGSTAMFNSTDANAQPINPPITNQIYNFGWEYVWHCHILSHEEMDMMRPIEFHVARQLPAAPILTLASRSGTSNTFSWTDATPPTDSASWGNPANEIGFRLQRAAPVVYPAAFSFATVATALANATTATNNPGAGTFLYRVVAYNAAGESSSNVVVVSTTTATPPAAPTNLSATLQAGPQIRLTWRDNANNEVLFVVERNTNGAGFVEVGWVGARTGGSPTVAFTDTTVQPGTSNLYRVKAVNQGGSSAYLTRATPTVVPVAPAAPSNLVATVARAGIFDRVTLTWTDNANNETSFTVQRSTSPTFAAAVAEYSVAANATTWSQTTGRGATYYYRIRANNGPYVWSVWSNVVSVTTP
mgnify:CR=1 FL=1